MVNRKRPIILRCPVTAEERNLIEQKMDRLQIKRICAYRQLCGFSGSGADDGAGVPAVLLCTAAFRPPPRSFLLEAYVVIGPAPAGLLDAVPTARLVLVVCFIFPPSIIQKMWTQAHL